jgi:hypothetical protein
VIDVDEDADEEEESGSDTSFLEVLLRRLCCLGCS